MKSTIAVLQKDGDTGTPAPAMNQVEHGGAKHQPHVEVTAGLVEGLGGWEGRGLKEALLKCVERWRRREKTMKEPRAEAELLLHLMNKWSKPDFWASSSCCLEPLQCEDYWFVVPKGSSVTSNMATAPKSSLSQITACLGISWLPAYREARLYVRSRREFWKR